MKEMQQAIRQEIVIAAPPERVFDAWADPQEIARWYVDRADGDARKEKRVSWIIGGEAEPLAVDVSEPGRRLVLRNVGEEPWKGSTVDVELHREGALTRLVVTQSGFSETVRDHVPNVEHGWACMLGVLKEYLEHHAGRPRRVAHSSRGFCPAGTPPELQPDVSVVVDALASPDAIARWAGERPARLLVTTPRGAVMALAGFPGVFVVMGMGVVSVVYDSWDEDDLAAATAKADVIADRLLARVLS